MALKPTTMRLALIFAESAFSYTCLEVRVALLLDLVLCFVLLGLVLVIGALTFSKTSVKASFNKINADSAKINSVVRLQAFSALCNSYEYRGASNHRAQLTAEKGSS